MTEPTTERDDEIVSAVLDGEATPEEVALVEADPALARRRDELAQVRDLVAEPVAPLDELASRRLLSGALPHAPRRELPWWRRPSTLGAGSAAAAVLVLAVLVGPSIIGDVSGDDSGTATEVASMADSTTTSAFEAADGGDTGYSDGEADDDSESTLGRAPSDTAGSPESGLAEPILLTYPDVATFDAAVRQRYHERSALDSVYPEATEAAVRLYGQLFDEVFIRCGLDFIDENLAGDMELVDQVEALVDGRRLVAVMTTDLPPMVTDDPTVVIIDPEQCETVTP